MRPLRIYFKNFMNHHVSEIDCTNFQRALIVGVSKKNHRISNGVGKTTIFRAIEYALFNKSHATVLDKIVRDGKKKAVVELDFELSGEIYRIYRHHTSTGSSDVRFYKKVGDEFESISKRTPSATNDLIRKTIKISHKAFTYSALFRQADLTGLTADDDPKKRREILKEPLNLSAYTKLEEMAVQRRRPIKKKIDHLEGSIKIIGNPDEDIEKSKQEIEIIKNQIKNNQELIEKVSKSLEDKKNLVEDLKKSLNQQDLDIHNKVSEQETALKNLKKNGKNLEDALANIAKTIEQKEKRLEESEAESKSAALKLEECSKAKNKSINELQQTYDKICKDELKGSELIAGVKAQMKMAKTSLPDGEECPTCHQEITEVYRDNIKKDIAEKLEKFQKELEFYEEALKKCQRKKLKVSDQLKDERKRLQETDKLESQITSLGKEQLALREDITRFYEERSKSAKSFRDVEGQILETNNNLETLKEAAEKSNAPSINEKIFKLNAEINNFNKDIKNYNEAVSKLNNVQGGFEERIKNRTKDNEKLIELRKELDAVRYELKIREMVVNAFSNGGIPNFIIQTILNELQYEVNEALRELRPELEVTIDADLNFEFRRNGIIRDYYQLSHGQHVYLALAFKKGTSKTLQKRLNLDIQLICFDEVDAHLDEEGVDAFADAIKKWQKDFTVFVITHNKDLKDKFSHAILVEEGDDGAEARVVTSW